MKTVGFITEYNPFHFGHKYHLEQSIALTGATHSLAIMSSSFVQRGEPSIVDKWTKAKMAVDNGVDLVIELPFIYSVQSAELFALGGIKVMEALNIIDYISFGSEIGSLEPLIDIADLLIDEPNEFKSSLKKGLNQGMSFPASRSLAIKDYFSHQSSSNYDYESILQQSNNILAIEYLKALKYLESNIIPITITRQGSNHNEVEINKDYSSASAIRKRLLVNGVDSVKHLVPKPTYESLTSFYQRYKSYNSLESYYSVIKYLLLTVDRDKFREILDIEDGLENRIVQKSYDSMSLYDLVENSSSKRYPKTRIQRILIHLLSGLYGSEIKRLYSENVPYIRFLAANEKGLELLNKIKKKSKTPLLTKFSHHVNLKDNLVDEFVYYETKATDIYNFGLNINNDFNNMDYRTSPYIKK